VRGKNLDKYRPSDISHTLESSRVSPHRELWGPTRFFLRHKKLEMKVRVMEVNKLLIVII